MSVIEPLPSPPETSTIIFVILPFFIMVVEMLALVVLVPIVAQHYIPPPKSLTASDAMGLFVYFYIGVFCIILAWWIVGCILRATPVARLMTGTADDAWFWPFILQARAVEWLWIMLKNVG